MHCCTLTLFQIDVKVWFSLYCISLKTERGMWLASVTWGWEGLGVGIKLILSKASFPQKGSQWICIMVWGTSLALFIESVLKSSGYVIYVHHPVITFTVNSLQIPALDKCINIPAYFPIFPVLIYVPIIFFVHSVYQMTICIFGL